jgi:pimeloyl-ACP methyl ester carboxylesterase
VILLGNSGGGSLFAFYLQQAATAPAERLQRAPSGDAVPLHETDLPPADGFVLLAAHLGEGRFLLDRLDPSMVDESDPVATDPRLDMYDPRNGYRPMQDGPSSYAPEFVAAFRAAQRARCERLDARALEWCEEARWHRRRLAGAEPAERARLARHALQRRYFLIYRTLADPRYLDPTLDPSQRPLGSIFSFGRDPLVGNYGEGLARTMSARGWLSTWSGLSSNAALERTLRGVSVPTLVICALADLDIHPGECRASFDAAAAPDKEWAELAWAGHYLYPAGPEGAKLRHPQDRVTDEIILPWLRARWPV